LALDAKQYRADGADAVTELVLNLAAAAFRSIFAVPAFALSVLLEGVLYHWLTRGRYFPSRGPRFWSRLTGFWPAFSTGIGGIWFLERHGRENGASKLRRLRLCHRSAKKL